MNDAIRELATVKRISAINPIPDADAIEVATIDNGWEVVVRKGEFSAGDLCVYHEIDSILPVGIEAYDFLTKGKKPYRLRTARLRGQISQGLAIPLHAFKAGLLPDQAYLEPDSDLTERLGVTLYEEPLPKDLESVAIGRFPHFIVKSLPARIQNVIGAVIYNTEEPFEVTEKLDGSYCAVYNFEGNVGFATKNVNYDITKPNLYQSIIKKSGWLDAMRDIPMLKNVAVIGEIAGPSIQKNRAELPEDNFYVFDVFDIAEQKYLSPKDRLDFISTLQIQGNGFSPYHVPIIYPFATLSGFRKVEDFMDLVKKIGHGDVDEKGRTRLEGLVFKSVNRPGVFSFKVISNQYLLDHGL